MNNGEFYIGWMPKAPPSIVRFVKRFLIALLFLVVIVGALIATYQKPFSTAKFEFGTLTSINGVYSSIPVPHLDVPNDGGTMFVPLVGYGKHGAEGIISDLEKERGQTLENKYVRFKGTLMYGDGKTLMQVDKNDNPLLEVRTNGMQKKASLESLGFQKLVGEVIDPKCFFGVMKPGEGKVHKDCAIRCISGGIPPVLKVKNDRGENRYVLLVGEKGEKLNDKIIDYVAVSSEMSGELTQHNDWLVMKVKEMKNDLANYRHRTPLACIVSCCPRK